MKYKIIENTHLSVIGQGWGSLLDYSDEKKYINAIRLSVSLGMNFIDTAEIYGNGYSEKIIGKSVSGIRDKVFIATKVSPEHLSYDDVIKSADASLYRLNTEYIDLYQIHWSNPRINLDETMLAMEKLVKEGKVRYIGVCNFNLKKFQEAQALLCRNKIISIQTEYNLFDRNIENDMLPYCEVNNMITIAYAPLGQGKIASEKKIEFLREIAGKYDKTIAQIVLNWLISHKTVIAIPHSTNLEHMKENAYSSEFSLLEEDINKINGVFTQKYEYISPIRIRVTNERQISKKNVYKDIKEALENKLEFRPSPIELSEEINKEGELLKPIKIIKTTDISGKYDYDLIGGQMRYWAWIIANGDKKPIFANIVDD